MKPLLGLFLSLIALAAVACTAPGEPPPHPPRADYHDLMRRETGKSQSALATARVVVDELLRERITKNYSTVTVRQSDTDITAVITDLHQVTAPTPQTRRAQADLHRVLVAAASTVASIPPNWNRQPQLRGISRRLAITAQQAQRISSRLD